MGKEGTVPRKKDIRPKMVGTRTLIIVGIILVVLGLAASFFFSQTIEKFFWEARTKSVIGTVDELSKNLQATDIATWNDPIASERLGVLASDIKHYLPSIAALKTYNIDGTLAWTDLKNIKPGYREPEIEMELAEVADAGHMIKAAGETTKTELAKTDLLEVWTIVRGTEGQILGYIELYFDSSDIVAFISQIQYSIAGSIVVVLLIIILLLRLTFRQQNDIIVRQAHELSDIFEQSPIGIYTINKQGIVTSINPKMLELLDEHTSLNIIGKDVFSIERIQKMRVSDLIHKALLGAPFDMETNTVDENGGETYRHYHGTPLLADDNKTIEQVLFMVEDITERKKLEQQVSAHTKTLEEEVSERTKNLQEKIDELEQFQRLTVGREIRMTELKQQIEKMRIQLEGFGVRIDSI